MQMGIKAGTPAGLGSEIANDTFMPTGGTLFTFSTDDFSVVAI